MINLEKLNSEILKILEPYLNEMIALHKENLRSVFVYGSAVGKDFVLKRSDINLAVILNGITLGDLKKSLKLVRNGRKKKILAPLFLTLEHIRSSADVFPIEFLEMKENHITVYGEELLDSLEINTENIRLQCEEQLKGKLIRLRQSYLEIGLEKKGIEALLHDSLRSLVPIFRNMLRLKGKRLPVLKEEIIAELGGEFGVDAGVFLAVLRDKQGDEKIAGRTAEEFLERYLEEIQKLAVAVDGL